MGDFCVIEDEQSETGIAFMRKDGKPFDTIEMDLPLMKEAIELMIKVKGKEEVATKLGRALRK